MTGSPAACSAPIARARSSAALASATRWSTAACCACSVATSASSSGLLLLEVVLLLAQRRLGVGEGLAGLLELLGVLVVAPRRGVAELLAARAVEHAAGEDVGRARAVAAHGVRAPPRAGAGGRAACRVPGRAAARCWSSAAMCCWWSTMLGLDVGLVLRGLLELRLGLVRRLLRGLDLGARPHDRGIGVDEALLRAWAGVTRRRRRRTTAEAEREQRAPRRCAARRHLPPHVIRESLRTGGTPLSTRAPPAPMAPAAASRSGRRRRAPEGRPGRSEGAGGGRGRREGRFGRPWPPWPPAAPGRRARPS